MNVRSLSISNFRSLKNIEMRDIGNLVILIGKNGSGKSNLLEALDFFFADINLQADAAQTLSPTSFYDKVTNTQIDFKVTIEFNEEETNKILSGVAINLNPLIQTFRSDIKKGSNFQLAIHRRFETNMWKNVELSFSYGAFIKTGIVHIRDANKQMMPLPADISNTIITNLNVIVKNSFKLIKGPRESAERTAAQSRNPTIDPESKTILMQMGLSQERATEISWSNCQTQFKIITDKEVQARGAQLEFKIGNLKLPIDYSGSGDQALLVLQRQLMENKQIYGIEEPETRMHNDYVRKLSAYFKILSESKQIFIATHSPVFVDKMPLGDVWYISRDGKETKVKRLDDTNTKNLLEDLGIMPSDVFLSNKILFVEGKTEKVILPIIAQKLNIDLSDISIIVINGKGNSGRHLELWSEIAAGTTLETYFILDKDAKKEADLLIKSKKTDKKHCHVLNKQELGGSSECSIEDYYDLGILLDAVEKHRKNHNKEDEEITRLELKPSEPVVRAIQAYLKEDGWKVPVGKEVVTSMSNDQIESEMGEIISFLRAFCERLPY